MFQINVKFACIIEINETVYASSLKFFLNWLSSLLWGLVKPLDQPCVSTCLFTYYMHYTRLVNHFSFSNFKMLVFIIGCWGRGRWLWIHDYYRMSGVFFFETSRPCCQPVIIWHSFFLDCGLCYAWSYFWHTSINTTFMEVGDFCVKNTVYH